MAILRISYCVALISCFVTATQQSATAQPPAPAPEAPAESTEAPEVLTPTPQAAAEMPCYTEGCGGCDGCDRGHCRGLRHRLFGESDRNCRDRLRRWADHHLCDTCYCPLPFGSCVNGTLDVQIAKGDAAQMVLYDYDFEDGGAQLTCRGKMQVQKLSRMLMETPYPVIIQAARCNENLDQARQGEVLEYLQQIGMPVPAERLVVQAPPARGLDGLDAEAVSDQIQGLNVLGGYRPLLQEHVIQRGYNTSYTGDSVGY